MEKLVIRRVFALLSWKTLGRADLPGNRLIGSGIWKTRLQLERDGIEMTFSFKFSSLPVIINHPAKIQAGSILLLKVAIDPRVTVNVPLV
jgi:hypothetical protein